MLHQRLALSLADDAGICVGVAGFVREVHVELARGPVGGLVDLVGVGFLEAARALRLPPPPPDS